MRVIQACVALLAAAALGALACAPTSVAAGRPVYTQAAHSGRYWGATSTATPGSGSIFQDRALNTSPGQLVCASAWLRTQFPGVGAAGRFVIWLLGGTRNENGVANYSRLGNLGSWAEVQTCAEATISHTALRIQFYPNAGSPTVDMDDIDVHVSLAANGGFEVGSGASWAPYPNTHSNYVDYAGAGHSGARFGATNTSGAGGGIFQDVALSTAPGQVICGSAWLRNEGSATGAAGQFVLWLIGGARSEAGAVSYGSLGNGSNWRQFHTCVEATTSHTALRIQFYPRVGSSTVEIDDVDVHGSLALNGGFEFGSAPWGTFPGTDTSYGVYRTGLVYGPPPPAGTPPPSAVVTTPVTVRLPVPKARHALKVKVRFTWTWRYGVTRLDKVKIGRHPARTRVTLRCLGRGCPRPAQASAVGRRSLRRMFNSWRGRRFRAGDRLIITLKAPGYLPEKASLRMRFGKLPRVRLLCRAAPDPASSN